MLFRLAVNVVLVILMGSGCTNAVKTKPTALYAISTCEILNDIKSTKGDSPIQVTFKNSRADVIQMYWINYQGVEEKKATISAGDSWTVNTFLTHPWVVRKSNGDCLEIHNNESKFIVNVR